MLTAMKMILRRIQLVSLVNATARQDSLKRFKEHAYNFHSDSWRQHPITLSSLHQHPVVLLLPRSYSSPARARDDPHDELHDDNDNNNNSPDLDEDACPVWLKQQKAPVPKTTTYFQVFGLTPHYSISLHQLQPLYKKLMIQYHPDKHHHSSAEQQEESDEKSALITRAYETLRDPQARALYLLDVLGHPLEESAKSQLVGQDFLMKVIEVREEIMDHHGGDDASFRPLWDANEQRIQALTLELAQAFDQQPPDIEKALRLTAMLQYWYRVEEKLLETMDEIPESR